MRNIIELSRVVFLLIVVWSLPFDIRAEDKKAFVPALKKVKEIKLPPCDNRWNDFEVIMWGGKKVPKGKGLEHSQLLWNNGVTAALAYRDAKNEDWWKKYHWGVLLEQINNARAYPLGWHKYNASFQKFVELKEKGDEKCYWRDPCFHDPKYLKETKERLVKETTMRLNNSYPLCYSIGDEVGVTRLTTPWDFCFSPNCMKTMQKWLKEKFYGDLKTLNTQWGTEFTKWSDVKPDTTAKAKRRKDRNYSSWNDHRAFMDIAFVNYLNFCQKVVKEIDPGAHVGIEGTQHPSAWGGYDLKLLAENLTYIDMYDGGGASEAYRSFRNKDLRTARAFIGAKSESLAEVWRLFMHGLDSGIKYLYSGFNDKDKPSEASHSLKEMRSGLYKLLKNSVRDDDPIAIHFSQPSIRATYIMQQRFPTYIDNEIANESDHERVATFKILEDLGHQWRFISPEQIEAGGLSKYKVFFMPASWAVSKKEEEAIAEWVKKGGVLVADGLTAWMDEHCKFRDEAGLSEVFGINRKAFKPAKWTVGIKARPVYPTWYSHYWWTFYPKKNERKEILLKEGKLNIPVMEGNIELTSAKAELSIKMKIPRTKNRDVGFVYKNTYGKGQAIFLNFRLLDYLDWRSNKDSSEDDASNSVPSDPEKVSVLMSLFSGILKEAGVEARCKVVDQSDQKVPGFELFYFGAYQINYYGLIRDNSANQEVSLDLEEFENRRKDKVGTEKNKMVTLKFPNGGGHIYDVRKKKYLGNKKSIRIIPHAFQPSIYLVSPYVVSAVELTVPKKTKIGEAIKIKSKLLVSSGMAGMHIINIAILDPTGKALPPFRGVNIVNRQGHGQDEIKFLSYDAEGTYTLVATELSSGVSCEYKVEVVK